LDPSGFSAEPNYTFVSILKSILSFFSWSDKLLRKNCIMIVFYLFHTSVILNSNLGWQRYEKGIKETWQRYEIFLSGKLRNKDRNDQKDLFMNSCRVFSSSTSQTRSHSKKPNKQDVTAVLFATIFHSYNLCDIVLK
jgi:hypothetical protein